MLKTSKVTKSPYDTEYDISTVVIKPLFPWNLITKVPKSGLVPYDKEHWCSSSVHWTTVRYVTSVLFHLSLLTWLVSITGHNVTKLTPLGGVKLTLKSLENELNDVQVAAVQTSPLPRHTFTWCPWGGDTGMWRVECHCRALAFIMFNIETFQFILQALKETQVAILSTVGQCNGCHIHL